MGGRRRRGSKQPTAASIPLWHAADIIIDTATSVGGPDSEENRKGALHSISAIKGESRRAPIPARPPGLSTDGWWFGW